MCKTKPTLIKVIKYEQDLKGHRYVQIFAGVGSGKNYFVERFIEGNKEYDIPKKTVLIITSRKAKVQEVLAEGNKNIEKRVRQQWDEFYHLYDEDEYYDEDKIRTIVDDWGNHHVYQKSVICTNAFIEQYLKYVYDPTSAVTHLWELFDIIIIDEVHSMIMDSTYQSAPFYINELVNEFLYRHQLADENPLCRRPLCEQIITMTGTREPIDLLSTSYIQPKIIDKMDACKWVQPKNVRFIELKDAKKQIAEKLASGERIIYFQNHTDLPEKFCAGTDIDCNLVVPSFSKDEKRRMLKTTNKGLFNKMEAAEESMRKTGMLPQSVKLLLTTGRNKEGINIEDKDIKTMYVESHLFCDIAQMAGRVREGVDDLYIVVDAQGYMNFEYWFESDYEKRWIAGPTGAANSEFELLCNKEEARKEIYKNREAYTTIKEHDELEHYISMIHGKHSYAKYSYFDNEFKYYNIRKVGMNYQRNSIAKFDHIIERPKACASEFKKWFPDAVIHPYYTVDMKAKDIFKKYIPKIDGVDYDEEILYELKEELKEQCYPDLNKLQYMLNRFCDLEIVRVSKKKGNAGYTRRKFIRRTKKAA